MNHSAYYESDVLHYFDQKPQELSLYQALFRRIDAIFPDGTVKVQKTQISFSTRHLLAAASLPIRRKKDWPEHCILVTFGLSYPVKHPRIAVAVEPYPNRWTHHVVISSEEEIDTRLLNWLEKAYAFSESKR